MNSYSYHQPVLLDEAINFLIVNKDGVYFDGTLGGGGYTEMILKNISEKGKVIATDLDNNSIEFCKKKFENEFRLVILKDNYKNIKRIANEYKIHNFDGCVLDLGISSYQIDHPESGFSYRFESDFDLRFDKNSGKPAYDYLNKLSAREIAEILIEFGEEKNAKKIARKLEEEVKKKFLVKTLEIVDIISRVVPRHKLNDTLSRVFQAFRIYVNDELNNLKQFLEDSIEVIKKGGRIVIISYHSLEDRIIKQFFNYESLSCVCPPDVPQCVCGKVPRLKKITKKVIKPKAEEIKRNPRARSAKLRVAEVL